jgi:hypothetical protein
MSYLDRGSSVWELYLALRWRSLQGGHLLDLSGQVMVWLYSTVIHLLYRQVSFLLVVESLEVLDPTSLQPGVVLQLRRRTEHDIPCSPLWKQGASYRF